MVTNFDPTKYGATTFDPTQYGATPIEIEKPKKEGLAKSLVKGLTMPVVKSLVKGYQAGKSAYSYLTEGALSQPNLDVNLPFYGKIAAPTATWEKGGATEVAKAVGTGIQTAALGLGGGVAGSLAGKSLLGIAKAGAIGGAKIGGIFGAGAGLEETGTAGGALKGAAIGATGGAVLGFSTPFAAKAVGAALKAVPGALKGAGKVLTGLTMETEKAENVALLNYAANKPTLWERAIGLLKGEKVTTLPKPLTKAETAAKLVRPGTEWQLGVSAKKIQTKLWNEVVSPALKAVQDKVNMKTFFSELKSDIMKTEADLSRRNQLLKALSSLSEDFGRVSKVSLLKLQAYKSGWAQFVPEKVYLGEPIAGALNQIKALAADKARKLIYGATPPATRTAYMDYGNLENIISEAVNSTNSMDKLSISREIWQTLLDKGITPISTILGKVLYKTGTGLEFVGDAGAKTVRDIIGSEFFASQKVFGKTPQEYAKTGIPGLSLEDVSKKGVANEFKVGDVIDIKGMTNMKGPVTIREIKGNTLKFTDAEGTDFAGMQRSDVRRMVNEAGWKIDNRELSKKGKGGIPGITTTKVADEAYQQTVKNGGVTINLSGNRPTAGYAYSPYKDAETVISKSEFSQSHIDNFINKNYNRLQEEGNHLGIWEDGDKIYIDISKVGEPNDSSLLNAKNNGQIAVFDLGKFETINIADYEKTNNLTLGKGQVAGTTEKGSTTGGSKIQGIIAKGGQEKITSPASSDLKGLREGQFPIGKVSQPNE